MKQLLVLAVILMSLPVFAETIYLNDGTELSGKIVEVNENTVRVEKSYGIIEIKKENIKKIVYGSDSSHETVKEEVREKEPSRKFISDDVDITRTPDYLIYKRTKGIGLGLTIPGSIIFGVSSATLIIMAASLGPYFAYMFAMPFAAPWMVFTVICSITGLILMIAGLVNLYKADKQLKEIIDKYSQSGVLIEGTPETVRVGWSYKF